MKKILIKIAELEKRLAVEIGPRGGKIIGRTKKGEPIYDSGHGDSPNDNHLTHHDHAEASKIHRQLAEEHPESKEYHHHMSRYHQAKGFGKALDSIKAGSGDKAHKLAESELSSAKKIPHDERYLKPENENEFNDPEAEKHFKDELKFDPDEDFMTGHHPSHIDIKKPGYKATDWQYED